MARVAIGSDHAGFRLKGELAQHLKELGHDVDDVGTHSTESVDYPDFGAAVGWAVAEHRADFGVLVCGTGIGISMAANKIPGVRAAVVHDATSARLTRQHNDANVLCLGERLTGVEVARDAVEIFLSAEFEGGRHQRRVDKIDALPNAPLDLPSEEDA